MARRWPVPDPTTAGRSDPANHDGTRCPPRSACNEGHSDTVLDVAFNRGGTLLASTGWDQSVRLWGPASGGYLGALEGHTGWVLAVAFDHSGPLLASASSDRSIRLWDTTAGRYVRTLEGHSDEVKGVAFSHDGRFLASASQDRSIRTWGPRHRPMPAHPPWARQLGERRRLQPGREASGVRERR